MTMEAPSTGKPGCGGSLGGCGGEAGCSCIAGRGCDSGGSCGDGGGCGGSCGGGGTISMSAVSDSHSSGFPGDEVVNMAPHVAESHNELVPSRGPAPFGPSGEGPGNELDCCYDWIDAKWYCGFELSPGVIVDLVTGETHECSDSSGGRGFGPSSCIVPGDYDIKDSDCKLSILRSVDDGWKCTIYYEVKCPTSPGIAVRDSCCSQVNQFCVKGGLGPDWDVALDYYFEARAYHSAANFHFTANWMTFGGRGGAWPRCDMEYFEVMQPGSNANLLGHKPGGYPNWVWDKWNDFSSFGSLPMVNADWYRSQKCPDFDTFTYSDQPMYKLSLANLFMGVKLLIMARVKSGCDNRGKTKCCALLKVDFSTETTQVIGPLCSNLCSELPHLALTRYEVGTGWRAVVDVEETFYNWGVKTNAMPWQLAMPTVLLNPGQPPGGEVMRCAT